jgi:hypothetical protein
VVQYFIVLAIGKLPVIAQLTIPESFRTRHDLNFLKYCLNDIGVKTNKQKPQLHLREEQQLLGRQRSGGSRFEANFLFWANSK